MRPLTMFRFKDLLTILRELPEGDPDRELIQAELQRRANRFARLMELLRMEAEEAREATRARRRQGL